MSKLISIEEFLYTNKDIPIIDVRSPLEYEKGHIPGAINIPLFNNEERAKVGTCYKQEGHDLAVELGLEIVGPKLASFTREAKKISPSLEIKVYCARGGMRSSSFVWLLETSGFKKVLRLEKGYKAFRNHVLDFFDKDYNLLVLSGMTGSGKTDILLEMEKLGLQVVDLEGFADHRGSAFGGIGKNPETSTEKYENSIFNKMKDFDLSKPIWVEDESRNVGKVLVPPAIFKKMETSHRVVIEVPRDIRAERLAKDYTAYGNETILDSLKIIQKRLSERYPKIVEYVKDGLYKEAAILILPYYDKSYTKGIDRRDKELCTILKLNKDDPKESAIKIKEITNG
ncbi:tRNA 2-selenouridine(34) synthase MnmH [Thiospirochaeta perfilievii]|uniref:tRNA 2-selenouridine(34) synthase MnmH n=1 Tax=Thiospirochaeta perfilievii TaxID=252967 RepID=A0A5C1QE14_9SPIO|nr:tRNA 2-selenouridine(34) synthase MnmH [Thiospirochaeta perfilievii]QEN04442.1 tRNA 2-selenouridine(34) synthase MnmH [Thiospirochaeta perfilievii]